MSPPHVHGPTDPLDGDGALLALASEELRGPLTSVNGFLQLLLDGEAGPLTEGQARMAEVAARNAEKMTRMIDDLIVIAQVRAGGLDEERTAVDVVSVVRERVFSAARELRARKATVGFSSDPCPSVMGDAPSVTQMVDQMLRGAITFVPPGGHIDVEVHRTAHGVSVEITDDGGEMDDLDMATAFEGGATGAARTPRALVGSRMGLQLIRDVARAHGGDATIHAGGGITTIRATLRA